MRLDDRKNRPWIVTVSLIAVGAVVWFAGECYQAGRLLGGGSRPGLTFGVVGGLICLFEMLLWPRKALRRWGQTLRLGWTQTWMRAHIWLGLLSVPLLVMHGRIYPWGGSLSTVLMALYLAVIASGVWGLVMQQVLPRRLLLEVPGETVDTQIDFVRAQLRAEAERLVLAACGEDAQPTEGRSTEPYLFGAEFRVAGKTRSPSPKLIPRPFGECGALVKFFQTEASPYLCPDHVYSYFRAGARDSSREKPPKIKGRSRSRLGDARVAALIFEELKLRLQPEAQPTVDALADLCTQCRQYERQARLHVWLHNWMAVHLSLSAAMIVLMVFHAAVALNYL